MQLRGNRGFTLVEVLVAVLLVSIALLGLAKLQTFGLRNTGSSYFRTQATTLLNDIVERARMNSNANYQRTAAESCPEIPPSQNCRVSDSETSVGCSADELASWDLYAVACVSANQDSSNIAPELKLSIDCEVGAVCHAVVAWRDAENPGSGGSVEQSVGLEFQR